MLPRRLPFLDSRLVRLAVNLPYRTKIRRSWRVRDWRHPFVQNKWILRQVASRYVPRQLSLRPKRPFPTNTFERMKISRNFLSNSSVADLLELSGREIDFLVDHGRQNLLLRLLHLSVWCDVCLQDESPDEVASRLCRTVAIAPDRWQPEKTAVPVATSPSSWSSQVPAHEELAEDVKQGDSG